MHLGYPPAVMVVEPWCDYSGLELQVWAWHLQGVFASVSYYFMGEPQTNKFERVTINNGYSLIIRVIHSGFYRLDVRGAFPARCAFTQSSGHAVFSMNMRVSFCFLPRTHFLELCCFFVLLLHSGETQFFS